MPTCPACRKRYPDDAKTCAVDGERLLPDEAFTAVDTDLETGQTVGEYQIEAKLGQGGFGCVYRAVHPVIGKAAAIKVLNRQYSSNPQMVSRFIAEARAVNQIRNRNIIDIFSFGTLDDGRQYYVMELLEGMTLDRYIKQRGRLSPEEAIPILRGVARALDAAHAAGIAHRDLKPENIFLIIETDGTVFPKLLDFGIAKLLGETGMSFKTRTGQPIGTPYYMSPEQCRGKNVDHRTDIYSFGIVVHEALAGKMPFTGDNLMDLLVKQTTAEPPPLSSACHELPSTLDAPILHMLAKEPDERPTNLITAVEALARAAQEAGFAVQAVPRSGDLRQSGDGAGVHTPSGMTPAEMVELSEAKTVAEVASPASKTLLNAAAEVASGGARRAPSRGRTVVLIGAISLVLGTASAALVTSWMSGRTGGTTAAALRLPPIPSIPVAPTSVPTVAPVVEPAPPAEVELTIQSTPKDVDVYAGTEKLGSSAKPIRIQRGDAPIKLTLKAPGYVQTEVTITPSANVVVPATLARIPAKRPEVEF